jgi:hypothetical protein
MGDKPASENFVNTICDKCGTTIRAEIEFCSMCGNRISEGTAVDRASTPSDVYHLPVYQAPYSVDLDLVRLRPLERIDGSIPEEGADGRVKLSHSPSERLISGVIKWEYAYGMLGLVLGLSSIIGGVILGLRGVTGSTSWTAKVLGLESNVNDAAPGVVLFIVGLFWVWVTKPKVRLKDVQDMKETRDRD